MWRVGAHLHLVKHGGGGEHVVAALGVLRRVRARPVRLAGAGHAHHQDHLRIVPLTHPDSPHYFYLGPYEGIVGKIPENFATVF